MSKSTVAVIGGGPYGLACTAHLRASRGLGELLYRHVG